MSAKSLASAEVDALNLRFEKAGGEAGAEEIIRWAADYFGGDLAMTSSFGADSMCTIHLATRIVPDIRIIFINTGYLFPETVRFMEEMRARFKLNVLEFHTANDPVVWLSVKGEMDPAVRKDVDACCGANKEPVMDRAMREAAPGAYLRGVRADQTEDRSKMRVVTWMKRFDAWAVSPILNWNGKQIHEYLKKHDLPRNPLWEKGYVSIGCNPVTCTRAIGAEDDPRAGRWAGTVKKECGVNLDNVTDNS